MNVIRKSKHVRIERYALSFEWRNEPGAGFSFPCDKQGYPLFNEIGAYGRENLEKCKNSTYDVLFRGVKDYSYTYFQPAQGRCSCGKEVELSDFTNTCNCGLEYNPFGQLLAPRSQWEEAY